MANSYVQYSGNGSTATFAVPFPYISKAHVAVTVDGVAATFTWPSGTQVSVSPAPASGTIVDIRRTTPSAVALVDFVDGNVLSETDLDLNSTQLLFINQEAADTADASMHFGGDGKFDAQAREVKNAAAPTAGSSLATKTYVDAGDAGTIASAAAAAASASSASGSATASASSATAAATSATNAHNSELAAAATVATITLPIPIAQGGTGQTSAAAARTALNVPSIPVVVAEGGTGAITAAAARTSLGAAALSAGNDFAGSEQKAAKLRAYKESVGALTVSSGTLTVDVSDQNMFTLAQSSNVTTFTITGATAGSSFAIRRQKDNNATARTMVKPSSSTTPLAVGIVLTQTALAVDWIFGRTADGTNWEINVSADYR